MHDVDLVVARELLRILGVQRDVRLGVVLDRLYLASKQAAGGVDLFHRERARLHHRLAVDVEVARVIEHCSQLDRRALRERRRYAAAERQRAGRAEKTATGKFHAHSPKSWLAPRPRFARAGPEACLYVHYPLRFSFGSPSTVLIAEEKSTPIAAPMLLRAGSCS